MPDAARTCATCLWWDIPDAGEPYGQCRRYAPRPHLAVEEYPVEEVTPIYPHWPLTLASEFCGEWQPPAIAQQRGS